MSKQSSEFLAILSSSSAGSIGANNSFSKTKDSHLNLSNFENDFPSFPGAVTPTQSNQSASLGPTQDSYGMDGLVHVIRATGSAAESPKEGSTLFSLGAELVGLGLDLNSSEPLFSKFNSPWLDSRSNIESFLPSCYLVPQSLPSLLNKLPMLSDESLLYVFYGMPRDKAQLQAASMLWQRGWRYHKGLKLWFAQPPLPSIDGAGRKSSSAFFNSSCSTLPADYTEKGLFVFWDFANWQRMTKEFVMQASMIELKQPVVEK